MSTRAAKSLLLLSGKAAFDRDCLQLTRDCATIGRLFEADQKCESFASNFKPKLKSFYFMS